MKADTKQAETEKPFVILELVAENIKRLKAVRIRPDGAIVPITGKNFAGKSSIFDAIDWALEGAKHIQVEPIRRGADDAFSELKLGDAATGRVDVIARRTFSRKEDGSGDYQTGLAVTRADGSKFNTPQAVLDAFGSMLTFDPAAFLRMKAKERFDILKRLVPGIDFDKLAAERKRDFEARTQVGRDRDRVRGYANSIEVPENAPSELIDVAELRDMRDKGQTTNDEIKERVARRAQAQQECDGWLDDAEKLRAQANELVEKAAALEVKANAQQAKLDTAPVLPALVDIQEIVSELDAAMELNAFVQRRQDKDKALAEARDLTKKYDAYTAQIEMRDAAKLKAIADAKIPVPGLSFGEGDNDEAILLNGMPLEQASTSEQIRAAVSIAMAMNPRLRVIFVREGSFLDKDSLAIVAEMAEGAGYQVWLELVRNDQEVGFVIENGEVVATHPNMPEGQKRSVKK